MVYTSTDPGLEALYLMYDLPSSTDPLPLGATAGPVHFHNAGQSFEVFFNCPSSILVLKDGIPFDVSDPGGGERAMRTTTPPVGVNRTVCSVLCRANRTRDSVSASVRKSPTPV